MSVLRLARTILRIGRMAAPATDAPSETAVGDQVLTGSVQVRHVDAGSCNGCEIEIGAVFGPVYDAERYGARLVASSATVPSLSSTALTLLSSTVPLLVMRKV